MVVVTERGGGRVSVTQGATNDGRGARVSGISIGKDEEPDRRVSIWERKARSQGWGLSDSSSLLLSDSPQPWLPSRKDEKLDRRVSDRWKGKTRGKTQECHMKERKDES